MNWYQGEKDVQQRFEQSHAAGRRSNELRELDMLKDQRRRGQRGGLMRLLAAVGGLFRRRGPAAGDQAAPPVPRPTQSTRESTV